MSIEGTSRARKSSEGCGKKSKKGHKRKVCLGAEKDNAECNNEVRELDEAVLNTGRTNEVQSMPSFKKSKRGEKMKDVTQQVHASTEETQEKGNQKGSKEQKRVKFNLESTIVPPDQDSAQIQMVVHANEAFEKNKPNDTGWVQKASWKSLVGESGRVAFSLGSMLGHNPGLLPGVNEKSMSACVRGPPMDVQSIDNVSAWIDGSTSAPPFKSSGQSNKHSNFSSYAKKESQFIKKSETHRNFPPSNHESVKTPVAKQDPQKIENAKHEDAHGHDTREVVENDCQSDVEKVCMFMRSDNYEQEWLEAKRAVKEIFKRSRKDALRSMKMFHTKHNQ